MSANSVIGVGVESAKEARTAKSEDRGVCGEEVAYMLRNHVVRSSSGVLGERAAVWGGVRECAGARARRDARRGVEHRAGCQARCQFGVSLPALCHQ